METIANQGFNSMRPSDAYSDLTITGSDYGLSPGQRQAIIRTNAGMLLIRSFGTNLSEILIEIYPFPFKKMHLKVSSGKWRPFFLGLNVLNNYQIMTSWLCNSHLSSNKWWAALSISITVKS